jgi:DNA polymerase-4
VTVAEPILHVDMDAFYATVEAIKDPSLRGKPVIVGGLGNRGVVTSASYEAREFGVGSAMPIVQARRLCPHGIYVPNDFDAYQRYSKQIREVFASFTPLVEPLSLDEAFLDVGGSMKLFGTPVEIAAQVKDAIAELGLGCTVGVASNKFLAKLASTQAKPDGLLVVPADRVQEFLDPLPVKALWGVGEQTGEALGRLGLKTVADVAAMSKKTLQRALGGSLGAHLFNLAHGIDERRVVVEPGAKSIGSEETMAVDLDSTQDVLRELLRLSDRTSSRLRSSGFCGRTVTIKVRFSNFKTITRSRTLEEAIATPAEIYNVAKDLYLKLDPVRPRIRLLGVTMSGIVEGAPRRQGDLLAERPSSARWEAATRALDDVRDRFGDEAVRHAALLRSTRPGGSE